MTEAPKEKHFKSPEKIIGAVNEWRFCAAHNDPDSEKAEDFITKNRAGIIEAMKGKTAVWEKVLGLRKRWHEETPVRYSVSPLGRFAEQICIETLPGITISQAQDDFDRLTDFLIEECGDGHRRNLTVLERAGRVRRRIKGFFR